MCIEKNANSDIVITDLLARMGYLQDGWAKIMVVDTFHLFPETMAFLKVLESKYDFTAEIFCADGINVGDKAAFDKKYGANLWREDIDEYDRVCKVEPFQRGLKTLSTDCMINGRTRWQGFERAWINLFENAPIGGGLAKCNPIAYWTLEDVFDYFAKYKIPYHPLHEKGYPSIGDAKDTIPIPEDGSVRFVNYQWVGDKTQWLDYARERVGRFVGLTNKDGSTKTECGIHVDGAERTWDRDLWEVETSAAQKITTTEDATKIMKSGKDAVLVVYAPWCPFSQKMEDEYEAFAAKMKGKMDVYTFRGDEEREFVMANLNTNSFPTVNVYVFFVFCFCWFRKMHILLMFYRVVCTCVISNHFILLRSFRRFVFAVSRPMERSSSTSRKFARWKLLKSLCKPRLQSRK
jgi:phosphoadenylyl-sulfate reductase (thioredoxin)